MQSRRQLVRKMIIKYMLSLSLSRSHSLSLSYSKCAGFVFQELLWHLRTFTLLFMAFGDRNVRRDWCASKFPRIQFMNLLINLWQCVEAAHSGCCIYVPTSFTTHYSLFRETYQSSLWLDQRPILSVHFVVEATGIAQIMSGAVASPQRRGGGTTVYALASLCKQKIQNKTHTHTQIG